MAYETDTGNLIQYQSALTGWTAPWNTAWGRITSVIKTANQTGISAETDISGVNVSFTAIAHRRYRVTCVFNLLTQATAAGTLTGSIYTGASGNAGTRLAAGQITLAISAAGNMTLVSDYQSPGAGTQAYHARLATSAGTCTVNASATDPLVFMVEDCGPNGVPA